MPEEAATNRVISNTKNNKRIGYKTMPSADRVSQRGREIERHRE